MTYRIDNNDNLKICDENNNKLFQIYDGNLLNHKWYLWEYNNNGKIIYKKNYNGITTTWVKFNYNEYDKITFVEHDNGRIIHWVNEERKWSVKDKNTPHNFLGEIINI